MKKLVLGILLVLGVSLVVAGSHFVGVGAKDVEVDVKIEKAGPGSYEIMYIARNVGNQPIEDLTLKLGLKSYNPNMQRWKKLDYRTYKIENLNPGDSWVEIVPLKSNENPTYFWAWAKQKYLRDAISDNNYAEEFFWAE